MNLLLNLQSTNNSNTSLLINSNTQLKLTGSKSETNRLLLLQALYPNIILENISNSDDSEVMTKALLNDNDEIIDIHHAGTAMRFLTAFFAIQEGRNVILTGSSRMKQRPIKILVDALKQLGATITYEENDGFPPIKIKGKKLIKNKISLPADVSSQYISALLLIASRLENGLELTLEGKITSLPYIKMTLEILNEIGIETSFKNNIIIVRSQHKIRNSKFIIESDWSSASYFYSIIALSAIGTQITISSYKENSLQGDSVLVAIYKIFGVKTTFENNTITISKEKQIKAMTTCHLQLNDAPDIAQTIAVTCFGLGIGCYLTGLHTLKIKETDRLEALQNELSKLGATIYVTNDSLSLEPHNLFDKIHTASLQDNIKVAICTYQDHRMAMAFAPLALKTAIIINDAEVVSKSYPTFWDDLKMIGFSCIKK